MSGRTTCWQLLSCLNLSVIKAFSLISVKEEGKETAFLPPTQGWKTWDNLCQADSSEESPCEAEIEATEENILQLGKGPVRSFCGGGEGLVVLFVFGWLVGVFLQEAVRLWSPLQNKGQNWTKIIMTLGWFVPWSIKIWKTTRALPYPIPALSPGWLRHMVCFTHYYGACWNYPCCRALLVKIAYRTSFCIQQWAGSECSPAELPASFPPLKVQIC